MEDEEEEEESSTTTTNPPFWIDHQQTNSTTTTSSSSLLRRTYLLSGTVSLLLLLSLLFYVTTSFSKPIININNNNINNIFNVFFNKGWDSINLTLVLLALFFGFLAQNNNPNHDDYHLLAENNIANHVNNHHKADIGPSSINPRTIEFDEKIENESVVSGWFEYSDQTDVTYPSDQNTNVVDDDDDDGGGGHHWRAEVGFGATIDTTEVHDSNESRVSVDTAGGVVLEVRDKIAFVGGLDGLTEGEVVEFDDDGTIGIVVTSSHESKGNAGVALMGEGLSIRKGSLVNATGKIAQVPGNNVGRVVEVLGDDIEGRCEKLAPTVRRRKRRTGESVASNGRSSEETSGVEQKSGKTSHRRTKSSGLELPGEKLSHRRAKSGGFERFGTVLLVGNKVARIYGLDDEVTDGEIVEFEDGTIGIVTNSESANNVGVVLMGDGLLIQEGSRVKATGKVAEIPDLGSVTNALAKPIDDKGKTYGSESRGVSEERETKRMLQSVRRRTRRTTGSFEEKGKSIEETDGFEREAKLTHRRKTKRTHEESVTIPLKVEANDETDPGLYESSPEKLAQDAPPQNDRNERKSMTRDFLTSLTKRKKKQTQKSIESFDSYDAIIESPPPSPPPPSKGFFSSKKGKGKKVIVEVPLPPPSIYVASQEQKSAPTTSSAAARRPPLPVKVQNFERESFTGAESPLHPIPSPPPPPPFKMSSWKFVVKGDYVNIGSVNSSRSVSPEREEVDSPIMMSSEPVGGDVATGSMFCPSPDVNSKADMFIAKFREGLKLQKMNSMKMKQGGVGLSNLGPVSSIDQAQA